MDFFCAAFSALCFISIIGDKPTSDLSRADFDFNWLLFSPLSTPISLPLPPLATFLDTLGGLLNSTGLTKLHEARSEEDFWSWFYYCIGNMARLGKVAL